jgi:hypothetical protein
MALGFSCAREDGMSLFANDRYRWRETYFVLFDPRNRPTQKKLEDALAELGAGYEVCEVSTDEDGGLESLTVFSASDFAGMDISYVDGEEVAEQIAELQSELQDTALTKEEKAKLRQVGQCSARFDIYHFEQIVDDDSLDDSDEYMDPSSLLAVLQRLATLCHGVGVDPQSGTLM